MINFFEKISSKNIKYFIKFSFVGIFGALVNYFFLYIFYGVFEWHYILAAAMALEISMFSGFFLNDTWTFKGGNGRTWQRFLKFNAVSIVGVAINLIVLWILKERFLPNVYFAEGFGILAGWLWNFFVNYKWTWKNV